MLPNDSVLAYIRSQHTPMSVHHRRVTVSSLNGIVAAGHPLAAQAGARILREGGNAFDAAVATSAALNVVEPFMSGLAGMGCATCYSARENKVLALDFVPANPRLLTADSGFNRADLTSGAASCGVPGNLAGWCSLVERFGTLALGRILQPAIDLAAGGFPLTSFAANEMVTQLPLLRSKGDEIFGAWESIYCPGGQLPRTGTVLRQPALSRTLEAIAVEGSRFLHGGALGRALVDCARRHGGALSMEDMEAVRPQWLEPLCVRYRGFDIHVPPPPSEAFQYLLTLRLLDAVDIRRFEYNGADHLDSVLRAIRLAAGVRIANNLPGHERLEFLLSEPGLASLRERLVDGVPIDGPTEQFIAPAAAGPSQHTTSLSIADRQGNAVCITQSLGSVFGCGVVLPEYGVCLNNFLKWADSSPEGTNPLAPGGALALPLAPSLALLDGAPALLLGSPGSYGIAQHQTQIIVRWVDYGLGIQEAIEEPRARLTDGRSVLLEARFSEAVVRELERRGHAITPGATWTRMVGGAQGIEIDAGTCRMSGGADPRRDGYVASP